MPLTIYRRHTKRCRVHELNLPPKARRIFHDCTCPIWITGTVGGNIYPRQSTGLRDWKAAQALCLSLRKNAEHEDRRKVPIQNAIGMFLASMEHEVSHQTIQHHRLALSMFADYCCSCSVYFLDEITPSVIESSRLALMARSAPNTGALRFSKVLAFLRYCYRVGLIDTDIAGRFKSQPQVYDPPKPFTDEEVRLILEAAAKLNVLSQKTEIPASTMEALLLLMLDTGMRVSDAIRFDPSALVDLRDGLWRYRFCPQKVRGGKAKYIDAYVRDQTYRKIMGCVWLSEKLPFLHSSVVSRRSYHAVYRAMQLIGKHCGISDCRPHRLRDTFAVRLLLAGVGIADVSRLLGHSSVVVTEKHYAPWTESRIARLRDVVAQALMHPPGDTGRYGQHYISPPPGVRPS